MAANKLEMKYVLSYFFSFLLSYLIKEAMDDEVYASYRVIPSFVCKKCKTIVYEKNKNTENSSASYFHNHTLKYFALHEAFSIGY